MYILPAEYVIDWKHKKHSRKLKVSSQEHHCWVLQRCWGQKSANLFFSGVDVPCRVAWRQGLYALAWLNVVHSSPRNMGSMGGTVAPFAYPTSDSWVQNVGELAQPFSETEQPFSSTQTTTFQGKCYVRLHLTNVRRPCLYKQYTWIQRIWFEINDVARHLHSHVHTSNIPLYTVSLNNSECVSWCIITWAA